MTAHALLAVIAANEYTDQPITAVLIPLTCNEIRRLFTALVVEPHRIRACPRVWSTTGVKKPFRQEHNDLRLEY